MADYDYQLRKEVFGQPVFNAKELNDTLVEAIWLRGALYSIRMCFLPVILVGTITNVFNFVVLAQREMRCLSTSVFLLALAVADLGVMYLELFRVWFEWMDFVNPEIYFSDWYCKFGNYINGVVRDFSNWLIACLTLERVIMVAFPFRAKHICTVKNAKCVTLMMFATLCLPHVHSLVYSLAQKRTSWVCWEDPLSKTGKILAATVEITVGYSVVIVVFVLNIALVMLLAKHDLPFIQTPKHLKKIEGSKKRLQRRLTRTLIIVASVFITCETPRMITSIICHFIERTPTRRIILNLSFLLSGINHASNFWIYIFSSPRFRHVFMKQFFKQTATKTKLTKSSEAAIVRPSMEEPLGKSDSELQIKGSRPFHMRETEVLIS